MNGGFVLLWRKSLDSAVWQDPDLWRTWTCCLMLAHHKAGHMKVNRLSEPVEVKPGQFVTGRDSFHRAMYPRQEKSAPHKTTVWRWLLALKSVGNLHIETHKRFSIITIVNWDTYQKPKREDAQVNSLQTLHRRSTDAPQTLTNNNDNNNINKKEREDEHGRTETPPKPHKTPIPENLTLTEDGYSFALSRGIHKEEVQEVFGHFVDYHKSNATESGNWESSWRNWVRTWAKIRNKKSGGEKKTAEERSEYLRKIAREAANDQW